MDNSHSPRTLNPIIIPDEWTGRNMPPEEPIDPDEARIQESPYDVGIGLPQILRAQGRGDNAFYQIRGQNGDTEWARLAEVPPLLLRVWNLRIHAQSQRELNEAIDANPVRFLDRC